jgi:hypothetical protein
MGGKTPPPNTTTAWACGTVAIGSGGYWSSTVPRSQRLSTGVDHAQSHTKASAPSAMLLRKRWRHAINNAKPAKHKPIPNGDDNQVTSFDSKQPNHPSQTAAKSRSPVRRKTRR